MATVDVMTAAHIAALINSCVATGAIDSSGYLTLTLADGTTTIDVGQVTTSAITDALVANASINGSNHLILTLGDGTTTIDVGSFTDLFLNNASINGSDHLIFTKGSGATIDLGLFRLPKVIRKPSDTSRASSATPTADPHLVMAVAASTSYAVDMCLLYDSTHAGAFRVEFTGPSGASALFGLTGLSITGSGAYGDTNRGLSSSVDWDGGSTGGGQISALWVKGTVTISTTAGNFSVLWSQATSYATAAILKAGSWLSLIKVD